MRKPTFRYFVLGTVVLVGIAAAVLILLRGGGIPKRTLLELELGSELTEQVPSDPFAQVLARERTTMRDVLDALERAGDDERVVGLLVRLGEASIGVGHAQELRDAVLAFRKKNKFAVAWADTFGEFGGSNAAYYIATAFDEIRVAPSGDVGLTGLFVSNTFFKGTLDKIGARFRGDKRYEYKNAFNLFTETAFTPAHKEATESMTQSIFGQLVRGIAAARKIPEPEVRALVDRGPLLAQEALAARLVDKLSYRDDVYADAKKRAGEGAELLYLRKYLERAGRPHQRGKKIALVFAVGPVTRGKSRVDPLSGSATMGADSVALGLRKAIEDQEVKAIVLRIDSPGGSYVGSDTIWRETVRAREAGKPVIASMANVAASGGYFVAMSADKIVAEPGTITGSIGVFGGKMVLTGLFQKIGLSFDHVQAGANAGLNTTTRDYTPSEWKRLEAMLDRIYADFTGKAARGRKLPLERLQQIAKGRVWTGEQAKEIGLVDELGGLATALRLARSAAGIGETEQIRVRVFPKPRKPPFEQLREFLGQEEPDNSDREGGEAALAGLGATLRTLRPAARALRLLTASPDDLALLAPELIFGP